MNEIQTINQFTPNMVFGDGITNALLYTQRLLITLGYKSKIYICSDTLDIKLKHQIYHIKEYTQSKDQLLFYHHSIGHSCHDYIMKFLDKKILIYHNITPTHFFENNPYLQKNCDLGREQLKNSAHFFLGSFADSEYNAKELLYYDYPNPIVLTILLDSDKQIKHSPNIKLIKKYSPFYNILFVGRVVSNKMQHQLIDVMFQLKQKGLKNLKLHIVGGSSEPRYLNFIKEYTKNLELSLEVMITGKVSDEDLAAYYSLADLYLSLSEHEGFAMPLIEAMQYDTPVLAFRAGGISTTVPKEAFILKKAPSHVADEIIKLQNNPQLRVNLVKKQKQHLKIFSHKNIINKLSSYISKGFKSL